VGLTNAINAINNGASRQQIVLGVENSLEYRMKYINGLYFTFLGRAADPVGMDVGLRILGGTPFLGRAPTVEQLKAMIISSPEYFQKHGGTNAGFLEGVYHDVLGRDIETASLIARSNQLASGTTRNAEALQILNSVEAAGVQVQADYMNYLHRDPDAQ